MCLVGVGVGVGGRRGKRSSVADCSGAPQQRNELTHKTNTLSRSCSPADSPVEGVGTGEDGRRRPPSVEDVGHFLVKVFESVKIQDGEMRVVVAVVFQGELGGVRPSVGFGFEGVFLFL